MAEASFAPVPVVDRIAGANPAWGTSADVVVVGAGAAGLAAALTAARGGQRVVVVTKGPLGDGATAWAQGGLAAAIDPADSFEAHVGDTLRAGAGLCDEVAVRELVAAAPDAIGWLQTLGARFDVDHDDVPALTREGGHSVARVMHAGGDASGAEVCRTLLAALASSDVEVVVGAVLDVLLDHLGRAIGVSVASLDTTGRIVSVGEVRGRSVVLATGGLGQAYAATTNPAGATGDGLAIGLRAGAVVRDVEFVQFHPTVLWRGPGATGQQSLITEALRGEGAVLIDAVGRRVMLGVHPLADLAPRDVVAAGMVARMAQAPEGIDDHLWLDATALDRRLLTRRFPTVLARCREAGIDPVSDPIPVAPAAHYACGGLLADLDGCTTVPGLFAVGEVACTGVHGANRLASNSLTEALVAGRRAGREVSRSPSVGSVPVEAAAARSPDRPGTVAPSSRALTAALTSRYAGMLRDAAGLAVLLEHLGRVAVSDTPAGDLATIEATNLHTVSSLVAAAAAARLESRGCHRRSDAPNARTEWQAHLLGRIDDGAVLLERGACRAAA